VVIVLDSSSLNHLLKKAKTVRDRFNNAVGTALDDAIDKGKLQLAVDPTRILIDEWKQTCGSEIVQVLITKWESKKGIKLVGKLGTFSNSQRKKLLELGFTGTIDKLIVKIAIVAEDHTIVSEDSDFWDPINIDNSGKKNAPVARFLREEFEITVLFLGGLIALLPA